eukprot:g14590.t1
MARCRQLASFVGMPEGVRRGSCHKIKSQSSPLKRFGWPDRTERPQPAQGCPELVLTRPQTENTGGQDHNGGHDLLLETFQRIGTRSGEFFLRGFTVKFVGDQAIDWGAVTKSWASYLTAEIFHPDTGLLTSGVFSGNSGLSLRRRELKSSGFFLPDWAGRRAGRTDSACASWYQFVGRFLAYCLYMNCRVEAVLGNWVYTCLLNDPDVGGEEQMLEEKRFFYFDCSNLDGDPFAKMRAWKKAGCRGKAAARNGFNYTSKVDINKQAALGAAASPNPVCSRANYEDVRKNEQEYTNLLPEELLPGPVFRSVYDCLDALRGLDPVKTNGLAALLEYPDPEDVEFVFCLDFSVQFFFLGEEVSFSLAGPGSADVAVTGKNRETYVYLLTKFLLKSSVHVALASFLTGFKSVLPHHCLRMLSPALLEGLLCGQPEIHDKDFADLKECVVVNIEGDLPPHYTLSRKLTAEKLKEEMVSDWFFSILFEMGEEERRELCQFWLGTTRVKG